MGVIELNIYRTANGAETLVAKANKWKFQDVVMGEQFITCTVTSETPIDWEIGDHCEFRGETYTLNYIPSVTQKAPIDSVQDAFTYENVKFDSFQDELTRCMMLDVTPTTPEYVAVLGTNHTGSSRFQLYCGETVVNGSTLTAVCALALKMQANLDRLYPNAWKVYVDTTTTYTTASGETLLVTHTDPKLLTFDNQTVAQALGLVHTEFKLDYCVKGRNIYIGYSVDSIDPLNPVADLTADDIEDQFVFGYGRGYADVDNQGKSLFQIKQISNSQQKIVTRLRALGSTKNLPYNYYFKKYGLLSQALFPSNLQLPGTFLPLGQTTDTADANGDTKWAQNNARSQYLRKVLGDTNDSYIDKNDNAASCLEGIREDCARWDGSNGDLPEIYPTIEGVTFGELRDAGVPDQTGVTGENAYQGDSVQPDEERVDCILAVGYTDNGVLVDDANIGDGVMPESEVVETGTSFPIGIGRTKFTFNPLLDSGAQTIEGFSAEGQEHELFTVNDVSPGNYFMVPTGPSYSAVAFRFSVSASAKIGFIIKVKQVSNGSTIAQWQSELEQVNNNSGEREMFLPELPDQATSGQVESIRVTELSDVVVSFIPVIVTSSSTESVTLTYQVGRSVSGEYDPEYTWSAVQGDVASKYPFHVFIKDMGFDLTATFNGETPIMAMKSGMCVGREFEIGENVQKATVNGIRGYLLTLNRVEDSNLHIYYPNEYYQLSAGDYFVLLNINMPDAYIRAAELRLLKAATEYLADNCETKYTYQPSIDDIYLQRNLDAMEAAGTPEKSIFWRLYAGLKFRFNGIPSSASDPLPLVSMTIEQVAITMGEGLTPKVELTLNDDVQQTTLQKLTVAVDRIYNGSIFGSGGVGTNMEAVVDICNRLFLSKTHDDTANGKITFNNMVTLLDLLKAKGGINVGDFLSGFLGAGAHIGTDGKSEFEEVTVRGALRAAELIFNNISAEEGEAIRSIGHGEIVEVDTENRIATLKLEGDEWATIDVGDICRGMYNTVNKEYDNAISNGEDANGFRLKAGFFSSYFKVDEILTNRKGECSFRYSLQPGTTEHPCPLMKFAVYGNFLDSKKERQSSMYITAVGVAPRLMYLTNVNDWQIKPQNIKVVLGYLEGLNVYEIVNGEPTLKTLHGDAGIFVEDNIYFGGILNQFTAADWEYIQSMLGQGLHAQLLRGSDNIVVDALGNVVGGIYKVNTNGTSTTKQYKLHTGVLVYDSGKKRYLKVKPENDETELKEDEFFLSYTCDGCTALRDGADFYITSIRNTNDGISGTALTDEQLAMMRNTNECRIHFIIVTANGWRTQITYPVKITHLDQSYITFDLDNQYDSISYRTQTKRYAGLPIEVNLNAYINGEQLPASSFVSTTIESDLFNGQITVSGNLSNQTSLPCGIKITTTKSGQVTLTHATAGVETDMEDNKHYIDISSVVRYAGADYESGKKRFTLQETTDSTLYKLLLSANAVSKDENSYTPSSIDVKLQIWDVAGQSVGVPNGTTGQVYVDGNALSNIYVKYIYGTYDPNGSNTYHATPPIFGTDVVTCFTVVAIDDSTGTVLDVESVTINAVGKDGAGQPWVWTDPKNIVVIDCDKDGYPLNNHSVPILIQAKLYWGDGQCDIDSANDVTVTYGGSTQSVVVSNNKASCTISIPANAVLSSSNIVITITGTDRNEGETHTANESISVYANRKGDKGDKGSDGAGQSHVIFNTDKFIIDCNSSGNPSDVVNFDLYASLEYGEDLCDLSVEDVSMVWSSGGVGAPVGGGISIIGGDTAHQRFTFSPNISYNSGLITVTLTGTKDGVSHTATQTVSIEINRSGRGISSSTTYYKTSLFYEGVTAPATDVNPSNDGWSATYIEPTEESPYLWRFSRTTYTDGSKTQTACELVQVWSNVVNRNLLSDTEFITGQMSMWNIQGNYSSVYEPSPKNIGISTSNKYDGHNAYRSQFKSNANEPNNISITLLGQVLHDDLGVHIIEGGKWYTLSFMANMYSGASSPYTYGNANLDINLKGVVDTDSPRYVDGEVQNIGDAVGSVTLDISNFHYVQFKNTSSGWKKHTFTFKTKSSLENIVDGNTSTPLMVRFMTTGVSSEQRNVYLSIPKLEVGPVATAYEAKRPVSEPLSRRDEWEAGMQYYQGSAGEPFMDVVHCNNQWYKCLMSHISDNSNKPVSDTRTAFWEPFTSLPLLASGLVLADQAIIDLLFSQKIMMYNVAHQLAASINHDGRGSYCIYYPETGRKMMELSAEGYIKYYNDDAGNTLEWRLGHGASVADDSTDDWKPVMMCKFDNAIPLFNSSTEFSRTTYYSLSAGSSGNYAEFSGIYSTHSNDIPIQQTAAAEGWYTKDVTPWEHLSENGSTWYGVVMLHITHTQVTSGGISYNVAKITEQKIRYYTGTSYVEEIID